MMIRPLISISISWRINMLRCSKTFIALKHSFKRSSLKFKEKVSFYNLILTFLRLKMPTWRTLSPITRRFRIKTLKKWTKSFQPSTMIDWVWNPRLQSLSKTISKKPGQLDSTTKCILIRMPKLKKSAGIGTNKIASCFKTLLRKKTKRKQISLKSRQIKMLPIKITPSYKLL